MTSKHHHAHHHHPLCFRKDGDPRQNPLPHEPQASHNQGQQHGHMHHRGSERSEPEKNKRADSRRAGSGY
jgi:hypothetical protein